MTDVNPHEDLARWRKAAAIADKFEELATTLLPEFNATKPRHWDLLVKSIKQAESLLWRQIAVVAGQRPPSEQTQLIVIEILRGRGMNAGSEDFFSEQYL